MSVNSSFADFYRGTPPLSSNSSFTALGCWSSRVSVFVLTAFSITNSLLLLPLTTLILYLGYQRRMQQCSVSTTTATSHSDIFTYHMVAMEMIATLGCFFFCVGSYVGLPEMMNYSLFIFSTVWCVKIHFHMLTCVERYLAVIHPVTYLGLKNKRGVKIRNLSIGCVWLLCFVWVMLETLTSFKNTMILYFSFVPFALITVCFCCISVLCALRRPGPGGVGGVRDRGHQSKKRAFHTIMTIMGALLLCLGGMLVCDALVVSLQLSNSVRCAVIISAVWLTLPSSLVLPLLFLQRAGKLPGCKH